MKEPRITRHQQDLNDVRAGNARLVKLGFISEDECAEAFALYAHIPVAALAVEAKYCRETKESDEYEIRRIARGLSLFNI